jgi:hypothetical protein
MSVSTLSLRPYSCPTFNTICSREGRRTVHRRVLVAAFVHGAGQRVAQPLQWFEIGKALPQVDRLVLQRQMAHHAEDGGTDFRQLGFDHHHSAVWMSIKTQA